MAGAMVCSYLPANVLGVKFSSKMYAAMPNTTQNTTPTAAIPEASRGHPAITNTPEDCYTLVTSCVHRSITADCYPAESVSDNTASPSDAENQDGKLHLLGAEDTSCINKN